jgi:hypothetical protein
MPRPPRYRGFRITLKNTKLGRTPLDEWSARRRQPYLTTHNNQNSQLSVPPVGFKPIIPASERQQTHSFRAPGYWDRQMSLIKSKEESLFPIFPLSCAGARPRSNWNTPAHTELLQHSWNSSVFVANILIMHIKKLSNCRALVRSCQNLLLRAVAGPRSRKTIWWNVAYAIIILPQCVFLRFNCLWIWQIFMNFRVKFMPSHYTTDPKFYCTHYVVAARRTGELVTLQRYLRYWIPRTWKHLW